MSPYLCRSRRPAHLRDETIPLLARWLSRRSGRPIAAGPRPPRADGRRWRPDPRAGASQLRRTARWRRVVMRPPMRLARPASDGMPAPFAHQPDSIADPDRTLQAGHLPPPNDQDQRRPKAVPCNASLASGFTSPRRKNLKQVVPLDAPDSIADPDQLCKRGTFRRRTTKISGGRRPSAATLR